MKITVDTSELKALSERLRNTQANIVKAVKDGINDAAFTGARQVSAAIADQIESPTPFTKSSMVVKSKATADRLEAVIEMKPIQRRYLSPLLAGGSRKLKPIETKFQGRPLLPGNGVRLNSYGNVPKVTQLAILAAAANGGSYSGMRIFVLTKKTARDRLPPGIYGQRKRGQVVSLFLFASQLPRYGRQIDFATIARKTIEPLVGDAVQRRVAAAIAGSK